MSSAPDSSEPIHVSLESGALNGRNIIRSQKTLGELKGVFADAAAWAAMDPQTLAYSVQMHKEAAEGAEGGLYFGASFIEAGRVGDEFFMTRGHFHARACAAEYYWGIRGRGLLLLMDKQRKTWFERVHPGSLHYIRGEWAHRLVNIGHEPLAVGACWGSDAGYDYATIDREGFSLRIMRRDGKVCAVDPVTNRVVQILD